MPVSGPFTSSGSPRPALPATQQAADPDAFRAELAASRRAFGGPSLHDGPPHEVLEQIEAAGRISRQLRESGHEMRFSVERGGRVKIELEDREGKTVRSLLASEAFDIAAGEPLS